jgi:anti-sigma B factor antagonist
MTAGASSRGDPNPDRVTTTRASEHCVVVATSGEVDAYSAPELRGELVAALAPPSATLLVVDLSRTTFLDSSALGALVGGLKRAREQDKRLVVVVPLGGVRRIFEITSLDRVFDLYETLGEALEA